MNRLMTSHPHQQKTETIVVPDTILPQTVQITNTWTRKEKILFSLLGVLLVGGTVYLGRKFVLGSIANKEESKGFEEGTPATIAKQIKMAFENDGWPGTNVTTLRTILREIPGKEDFSKVVQSYQKLYNSNLVKDMSEELQSSEYNEMLQIIAAKPLKKGQAPSPLAYAAWAKRMRAAFEKSYGFFGGTDAEAIVAVFTEIPTQSAFLKVVVEYKRLYGTNMLDDLKNEGEFGQYKDWMRIITAKRK